MVGDPFQILLQNSIASASDSHSSVIKDDESQVHSNNVSENQNPKYEIAQIHSKQQQQPRQEMKHEKTTHDSIFKTQSLLHPKEMNQQNIATNKHVFEIFHNKQTLGGVNGTKNNYNYISNKLNADSRRYAKNK